MSTKAASPTHLLPSMTDTVPIWDVYSRQLFPLRFGYPLWDGHPHSAFNDLELGSVVYQEGGKLFPLFHAMRTGDDSKNEKRVPDEHAALDTSNLIINHWNAVNQREIVSKTLGVREFDGGVGGGRFVCFFFLWLPRCNHALS